MQKLITTKHDWYIGLCFSLAALRPQRGPGPPHHSR